MNMGTVYEEIVLINGGDVEMVERGLMKEPQIRQMTVTALVDTGATNLVIGEAVCQKLGLAIRETRETAARFPSEFALRTNSTHCSPQSGGAKETCKVTASVIVRWKDRQTECPAVVLPNDDEVLLGVIPLEGMDLMVNPVERRIVGAHGDKVVFMAK
jgi:predicted aspartyl protease